MGEGKCYYSIPVRSTVVGTILHTLTFHSTLTTSYFTSRLFGSYIIDTVVSNIGFLP
jgi:hypothetical protein